MKLGEIPNWYFQCSYLSELNDSPVYYTVNIPASNYLEACKKFMMDILLNAPGFADVLKVKTTRMDDSSET